MMKKITWAIISCAALAACAQPISPRPQSLTGSSSAAPLVSANRAVSAGASDEIGGYIPMAAINQQALQEASAAPTH